MFVKITPIKFKKQADTNISYGLIGIDKIKVKIGNDEFLLNQTHIKKWQDEIRKNINQFEVLYKFQFEHSFQIVSKLGNKYTTKLGLFWFCVCGKI